MDEGNLSDQHVEYTIRVRKTAEWTVQRRFRDFEEFRSALKAHVASKYKGRVLKVPSLPKKRGVMKYVVGGSDGEEHVAKRGKGLDVFLESVLNQKEFLACPDLSEFLTKPTPGHVASRGPDIVKISEVENEVPSLSSSTSSSLGDRSVGMRREETSGTIERDGELSASVSRLPVESPRTSTGTVSTSSSKTETLAKKSFPIESPRTAVPVPLSLPKSVPIESQPTQQRSEDDLLSKLSDRQIVIFQYEDEDEIREAISEGLVFAIFPKCNTEIPIDISESKTYNDRVEFRGGTTINGHVSLCVGFVRTSSGRRLDGEAQVLPVPAS